MLQNTVVTIHTASSNIDCGAALITQNRLKQFPSIRKEVRYTQNSNNSVNEPKLTKHLPGALVSNKNKILLLGPFFYAGHFRLPRISAECVRKILMELDAWRGVVLIETKNT